MKTSELIEHLSKLPQDTEVHLYVDGDLRDIEVPPFFDAENFDGVNLIVAE